MPDEVTLSNAQRCSIKTLKSLRIGMTGPQSLYPGAEHYEVVMLTLYEGSTRRRDFLVAVGGCVTEVLR